MNERPQDAPMHDTTQPHGLDLSVKQAGVTWWTQAWRTLWRDARAGELRLLVVAVALGVAALSSVSFLADRLNGGLQRDARQLLGGDVVVVSDQATPDHIMQRAKADGLQGVITLSFPTMARGQSKSGAVIGNASNP
jgi:putative ABC transport system permease protein